MQIRLARQEDIPEICHIYELAREHMRAEGNTSQWKKYPNETNALEDLAKQALYVLEEDDILGAFSFFTGEEKNYRKIEGGAWRKAEPYGTIHRVASSGKRRGITKACFSYFRAVVGVRSLVLLQKQNFCKCKGKIPVENP